jgi:hypothetical protein
LCGIGLDYVIKKIQDHPRYSKAFVFGILIFAVGTIMYYPEILSARWDDTSLRINEKGRILEIEPSLPITRHIIQDDIFLFQNIKNQNFIAPPWKGLAVGIATHNYPLESKTSIISNKLLNYKTFIDADCETKRLLAQTYAIAYVYSSAFDCPNFTLMGSSVERLYLYRVE